MTPDEGDSDAETTVDLAADSGAGTTQVSAPILVQTDLDEVGATVAETVNAVTSFEEPSSNSPGAADDVSSGDSGTQVLAASEAVTGPVSDLKTETDSYSSGHAQAAFLTAPSPSETISAAAESNADAMAATDSGINNFLTDELIATLRSANGPPTEDALVQTVTSEYSSSQNEGNNSFSSSTSHSFALDFVSSTVPEAIDSSAQIHLTPDETLLANEGLITKFESTISGNGSVDLPVRNHGVISPGNSPGFLQFTDLTLERSSTLVIEIGGSSPANLPESGSPLDRYDQINVTGNLVFGGSLDVDLLGGFSPSLGQEFDIVTYANGYSGSFDNYEGLVFANGLFFKPIFGATKLTLRVMGAASTQPRPVVFIPGFAGSFAADTSEAGMKEWFLNRGLSPDKLVLEPLSNAYSNLVQSLVNVGYTSGVDLFVANWDWRVPVALQDVTGDGFLSSVTASTITDTSYESGVDYLGYWLDRAVETWDALTGAALAAVDFVTHSTGGLVARSYIQSAAYQSRSYNGGAKELPQVNQLIQSGVPNQGVTSTFNFLQNDFSDKSASRVLGRVLDIAYDYLLAGEDIHNPDGSIIDDGSVPSKLDFIPQYIGTLRDLLGAYDFADLDGNSSYEVLSALSTASLPSGSIQNDLLYDLNAPGQYGGAGNLYGGVNGFVDRVLEKVTIVYSASVDMTDRVEVTNGFQPSKGLKNEILPFDQLIGNLPDGDWYFDEE